jgi:type I restriction-modification system DNA methylase subunit
VKKQPAQPETKPADLAGFERFQTELARLVAKFERGFKQVQGADYNEAKLRMDFLDPLFLALGWDITNDAELIPQHREVEIESRTEIAGRQKRADYLFRTDRQDRFVCEAKKPAEKLHAGYAFQAKRYAWNKGLVLAVLSDFEEMKIYLVGSKPRLDETEAGEWKTWHFLEYAKHAQTMWDLLSRDAVASGSIERLVASLPRKPVGKTKAKQQWLFKPDRARAIDADFLDFLDEARRGLASDLIRHNDRADLLEGTRLDEAVQRILDRLLFLRICEDRDIDTGRPLATILKVWRDRKDTPLWRDIVAHFRALDRRPASHIPYFNGNLFKEHFSETLEVGDEWISGFLEETGDEESAYLFNVIPVEILGTIYERFLGKTVRPHGRGVVIEEKPEVRKAGGVYYTPRYIVDYIVEQTLGTLLAHKSPLESLQLRVLDPACGSGSFLIRAYERLCEHWQIALTKNESLRRKADCWTDPDTGDVHLTSDLKRRILTANIYGVDLDPGAVEVSQLSLYLKMLEGESRVTLAKNRELFGGDAPLLPPLQNNIKCGNSLIASDFSLNPDDLVRVRAFDWPEGFRDIMQNGGFDVVIGNPPYIRIQRIPEEEAKYIFRSFKSPTSKMDLSLVFLENGLRLSRPLGRIGFICTSQWLSSEYGKNLRKAFSDGRLHQIVDFGSLPVFAAASTYPAILVLSPSLASSLILKRVTLKSDLNLKGIIAAPETQIQLESLGEKPWTFGGLDITCSADRSGAKCKPLAEYGKAYIGTKCGLNEAFVLSSAEVRTLGVEKGILIPYAYRGAEVDRYLPVDPDAFIIYPYRPAPDGSPELIPETELRKMFPRALAHLESFKAALRNRQDSRKFYARGIDWYRHLRAGSFNYIRPAKLALKGIALRCSVGLLREDSAFDGARCPCVILNGLENYSQSYFLGLLNSKLATYHLKAVCPPKLQGYIEFSARGVTGFPVRVIDFSSPSDRATHDKLVSLVDKMLLLVPKLRATKSEGDRATLANAVAATDRAIDALVYELYGLTPDEIALVEKG